MIHFVVPAGRENLIHEYLAFWGRNLSERMRILHYETLVRQTRCDRGTYVLSTLDELSPAMERAIEDLHRQLDGLDGVRILNHPIRTLRRYDLLAELRRLDLNEFRAVRASEDFTGLRYPVFIRAERSHDGAISPLLHSATAVEAGIGRALVQGHRLRDLSRSLFDQNSRIGIKSFCDAEKILNRELGFAPKQTADGRLRATEGNSQLVLGNPSFVHNGQNRL